MENGLKQRLNKGLYMIKLSNRNNRIKLFLTLCIFFLVYIHGCAGINENIAMSLERPAIEKAVCKYFDAEMKRDLEKVYECLAPSSIYRSTHTYEDYIKEMEASPVRIKKYDIIEIHDLKTNEDREKYPSVEKFARVEVEVTFFYTDTEDNLEVNHDLIFIKENGRWYKG